MFIAFWLGPVRSFVDHDSFDGAALFAVTAESLLGREFYEAEQPIEGKLSLSVKISPFDREMELNESSLSNGDRRFDLMLHRPFILHLRGGPTGFHTVNLSVLYDTVSRKLKISQKQCAE